MDKHQTSLLHVTQQYTQILFSTLITLAVHHHAQSAQQFKLDGRHVGAQKCPDPLRDPILQHTDLIRG